jgi:hypothetical protein
MVPTNTLEENDLRAAVVHFVKSSCDQAGTVPSIACILKQFHLYRTRLYALFPGRLAQICREAGVPIPMKRIQSTEVALKVRTKSAKKERLQEGQVEMPSPELEKRIFERLCAGQSPERIVSELGYMQLVDRCVSKWRQWRSDDHRKALRLLKDVLGQSFFGEAEYPLTNGIAQLSGRLARANELAKSRNDRIRELEDDSVYYQQRFDGARLVFTHFARKIAIPIVTFTNRIESRSFENEDEVLQALVDMIRNLAAELSSLTSHLDLRPNDPMYQLIGKYAEIVANALRERQAQIVTRLLEQLRFSSCS